MARSSNAGFLFDTRLKPGDSGAFVGERRNMKKMLVIISVIGLGVVARAVLPDMLEARSWRNARNEHEPDSYARYLKAYPSGKHVAEARKRYHDRSWEVARQSDNIPYYSRYVAAHPNGEHLAEARSHMERLYWQKAASANTIVDCRNYLAQYPEGKFAGQAKARETQLRDDDSVYLEAKKAGTEQALTGFLHQYPGHKRADEARAALKDIVRSRSIANLVKEGKITVNADGDGIETIQLHIRNRQPHPLVVYIPAGTFFESVDSGKQNMVATASRSHQLEANGSINVIVPVACANKSRSIPHKGSDFRIRESSGQADLDKLMEEFSRVNAAYPVKQAAVWIVTDNASFSGLGSLQRGMTPFGGSRVITADHAGRAMKLCYDAGIAINRRAIWRDRHEIANGVRDRSLEAWLTGNSLPDMTPFATVTRRDPVSTPNRPSPRRNLDGAADRLIPPDPVGGSQERTPNVLVRPQEQPPIEVPVADLKEVYVSSFKLYELSQYDEDYGSLLENAAKHILSRSQSKVVSRKTDAALHLQIGYGLSFRAGGMENDNLSRFIKNQWRDRRVVRECLGKAMYDLCIHLYVWDAVSGRLISFNRSSVFPEPGNVSATDAFNREGFLTGKVTRLLGNLIPGTLGHDSKGDIRTPASGGRGGVFRRAAVEGPTGRVFVKFDYGTVYTYHWADTDFEHELYRKLFESGWECVLSRDIADCQLQIAWEKKNLPRPSSAADREYRLSATISILEAGAKERPRTTFRKTVAVTSQPNARADAGRDDTIGQWRRKYASDEIKDEIIEGLANTVGL